MARELVRRRRWNDAVHYLERGLPPGADHAGRGLLARALYEVGRVRDALATLERAGADPQRSPEEARLMILSLERAGRIQQARVKAEAFLAVAPGDVVVQAVLERIAAPLPDGGKRGADPFYTVERAERYAQTGRVDRAIRTYRRILMYHQKDLGLESRLRQLTAEATRAEDDLSEELVDPAQVPPEPLHMPDPQIQGTPLAATPRAADRRALPEEPMSEESEPTEVVARTSGSGR